MFSLDVYQKRRTELFNELKSGVVIIPSYSEKLLSDDTHYKYRSHSDVVYFSGFPEPNTTVVIENNDEKLLYHLFVPKKDKLKETWDGKRFGVEGAIKIFGADTAYPLEKLEEKLTEILKKHEVVYFLDGVNTAIDATVGKSISTARNAKDRSGTGPVNIINPQYIFHKLRVVKSKEEIEVCKKSAKLSADAMSKAIGITKPGLYEYQIDAVLDYEFRKHGSQRAAYPTIVGGGVNGTILHYITNNDQLKDGDLVLVDAGAQYQDYCTDITRTWPINGKFSDAQKHIYELVLKTQKECIRMLGPGVIFADVNKRSTEILTEGLISFGLLQGTVEENVKENKFRRFYMHGLGHWLGIDVHDTSKYRSDKEKLVEGNYLTIEPGIYIPNEDDINEKYRGIAVRIEDDVLITQDGCEVLTSDVVKEIDEIENLVGTLEN